MLRTGANSEVLFYFSRVVFPALLLFGILISVFFPCWTTTIISGASFLALSWAAFKKFFKLDYIMGLLISLSYLVIVFLFSIDLLPMFFIGLCSVLIIVFGLGMVVYSLLKMQSIVPAQIALGLIFCFDIAVLAMPGTPWKDYWLWRHIIYSVILIVVMIMTKYFSIYMVSMVLVFVVDATNLLCPR